MDENLRTQAARDNDDRDLIENAAADAAAGILPGSFGGIHGDLDKRSEILHEIEDPDATVRPTKSDDIAHDQAYPSDRR